MTLSRVLSLTAAVLCCSCTSIGGSAAAWLQPVLAEFENDEHRDLHSIIVLQNGKLAAEQYYNGGTQETLVDIRSAGKSITSLLVGIALDRGAIESLEDPVERYWPTARGAAVGGVRLADILTMRSGLAADDDMPDLPGNEDFLDEAADPRAFALAAPRAEEPGTRYRYNSLAAYIAGIVTGRATGHGLEAFARETLFAPLDIQHWDWQEDRSGETKGQGNLFLSAPDFAHIGQMVLDRGVYQGRRVVSSQWIEESLKPRIDISGSDPFARGYGYYWYQQTYTISGRSIDVFFASGNGGNKIYVVPSLAMVVSILSRAYGQRHGQRRSENILKAVLAATLCPPGDVSRAETGCPGSIR